MFDTPRAASFAALAFGCWLAGPAGAQERPGFDCSTASGLAERMVCSDADLGASDGRMAGHVATVTEAFAEQGEDGAEALQAFEEAQEAFVETRDACARSTDPRACVEDAYATREADLVASFELQEPAEQARYTCDGDQEISISIFDTDRPAIRIEGAGEEAVTGASVPTADSQAGKFALSSGQDVWIRKDVARFTAADGATVTCLIDEG